MLVHQCHSVETKSQDLVTECYLLQDVVVDMKQRDELLFLASYAKNTQPKCSAAGFFYVNKLILGSFFSTLTTYLIICIQFRTAE
uniref:Uncharacterized protein LOC114338463 n=1 Tax=Diabrotica virgifera virgifera TaxID=50390 RepID=A0A6P7GM63_DIAVI